MTILQFQTPDLAEAREAIFTPSPLDLLNLAQLRHEAPELAERLATEAGRQFDRQHRAAAEQEKSR